MTSQNAVTNSYPELEFDKIDISYDEGLRKNTDIYKIAQDQDGVLWLGSTEDLYRFNGNSTLNVTQAINNRQANIIASRWVTALAIDSLNNVWFGTTKGLYMIENQSMHCKRIKYKDTLGYSIDTDYINKIDFIKGETYISTRDGVFVIDKDLLIVKNYIINGKPVASQKGTSSNSMGITYNSTTNSLYITTRIGLIKIAEKSIDTFSYAMPSEPYHYPFNPITIGDKIAIPDYKYGVMVFDISENKFLNKKQISKLDEWARLKSMIHLKDSVYLVNAEKKGIAIYDINSDEYHWLHTESHTKAGMYDLMKDKNGNVWFATRGEIYKSNLSFKSPDEKSIHSIDISAIFANGQKIWTAVDSITSLELDKEENNIKINYYPTAGTYDKVSDYSYTINNREYYDIDDQNSLPLYNLGIGKHNITINAKTDDGLLIRSREISIYITQPYYKSSWFYLLLFAGAASIIYVLFRYNKSQYIQKEKLKREYENKLSQLENQALRSQINPHFIFNTLNSIKYYSIQKSAEETSDFISSFSILIRSILENSKKSLITLKEEISTLKNYTEIESLRFHEGFEIEFYVDDNIATENFLVPPMIIQPFVENAIWHGLMHKKSDRKLSINILGDGTGIICQVIDNGIGREHSKKLKKSHSHKSSLGMQITQERMQLINKKNQMDNTIKIIDLVDTEGQPSGTQVNIYFKFIAHNSNL